MCDICRHGSPGWWELPHGGHAEAEESEPSAKGMPYDGMSEPTPLQCMDFIDFRAHHFASVMSGTAHERYGSSRLFAVRLLEGSA